MGKHSIKINETECKGCSICVSVCPVKILELNEHNANAKGYFPCSVITEDKCIGCTNCALMCPDSVITICEESV